MKNIRYTFLVFLAVINLLPWQAAAQAETSSSAIKVIIIKLTAGEYPGWMRIEVNRHYAIQDPANTSSAHPLSTDNFNPAGCVNTTFREEQSPLSLYGPAKFYHFFDLQLGADGRTMAEQLLLQSKIMNAFLTSKEVSLEISNERCSGLPEDGRVLVGIQ